MMACDEDKIVSMKLETDVETRPRVIEAMELLPQRGVSVAAACRDVDLAKSFPRRWMREALVASGTAFFGHDQKRAELAEVAALKNDVPKL